MRTSFLVHYLITVVCLLGIPVTANTQPLGVVTTFDRSQLCAGDDRLVVDMIDLQDGRLDPHWNFPIPEQRLIDPPTRSSWRETRDVDWNNPIVQHTMLSISLRDFVNESGLRFPESEWDWETVNLTHFERDPFGPRDLLINFFGSPNGRSATLTGIWPEQILYPPYTNLVTVGSAPSTGGRWETMVYVYCSPSGSRSTNPSDSRAGTGVTLYRDQLCAGRIRCANSYASTWYSR